MGKKNFKKKEKKEGHVRVVLHGLAMEGKKKSTNVTKQKKSVKIQNPNSLIFPLTKLRGCLVEEFE